MMIGCDEADEYYQIGIRKMYAFDRNCLMEMLFAFVTEGGRDGVY